MNAYPSNYDDTINLSIDATECGLTICNDIVRLLTEKAVEELNAENDDDAAEIVDLALNIRMALKRREKTLAEKAKKEEEADE